ncbi:apolipoprotein B receptor [Dermochelys coriacea]|uniref:apolipoprotein B receptor n=1 Tax=Dermochelys coriacea TaxID=27794 RepID=UPI001CA8368D|nr:apolipoprotein B receptor [Dermochelys coriacea]
MELLQRHLPGLHRVLWRALDYVSTFSTYLFGDQAHPGAEDHRKSREMDSPDHPKGVPTDSYGEGEPEHHGEEALGGQLEDAGPSAPQVPPDIQDPTPQEGHMVLRGSGAHLGSVSDQDIPHPLWSWPGAMSLEPRSGELTAPGGRAPPPSPSLSREPSPPASEEGWGRGHSIWQGGPTKDGEGPEEEWGLQGTGRIWLEEQVEPRGNPCLQTEKEGGTWGASPMQEGGLWGSDTQWGPGASSLWLEEQGREGVPRGSSPQLGTQGEGEEGESRGGEGSLRGVSSCYGDAGEGSEDHPLLCPVPQPDLPDAAQSPLPEPGEVSPLDASAQWSRVLLRRKGSVRRAPSLRAQRPPGGAPPETLPQRPQEPGTTEGFLPPMSHQPQTPRRQLPGQAGFGLAHPNMMAELKFRLHRPPPQ